MENKCQEKDCNNVLNVADSKRIYVYDENIQDEVPLFVCDSCYLKEKQLENDIDWEHSVVDE